MDLYDYKAILEYKGQEGSIDNISYVSLFSDIFSYFSKREEEGIVNKDYYQAYSNVVKRTADLILNLGVEDPYRASVIFEYLLWNGYLSRDGKFSYSVDDSVNIRPIYGASVLQGSGVCLNIVDISSRVLQEMGIKSSYVSCYLDQVKSEYLPNIDREYVEKNVHKSFLDKKIASLCGNHAITVFCDSDDYFGIDPTNLVFVNLLSSLSGVVVGGEGNIAIKSHMIQGGNLSFSEIKTNDKHFLTLDQVKRFSEEAIELCDLNSFALEKFYQENQEDIHCVCKELKKVK